MKIRTTIHEKYYIIYFHMIKYIQSNYENKIIMHENIYNIFL